MRNLHLFILIIIASISISCGYDSSICARTGFYECRATNLIVELHNPLCETITFLPPNEGSIEPITSDIIKRRWVITNFNVVTDMCDWVRPIDDMYISSDIENPNIITGASAAVSAPDASPGFIQRHKGIKAYFTKGK